MTPDIRIAALYYLGYCREKQGDAAGAEKAYLDAVAGNPDSPFVSFAALALGRAYRTREGKAADARKMLALAAEKPATETVGAEALYQLAGLEFDAADFAASAAAYRKLSERYGASPRVSEGRQQAAWAYYHAGQYRDGALADGEQPGLARPP